MNNHQGKTRCIKKYESSTPILIPSFSSKGFPQVQELHNYLKPKLTAASLVSTYDLHYGYLLNDDIYESDILFVDSGGYERNQEHDISDIYNCLYFPRAWNESLYEQQLKKLKPVTDIVIVNFDYAEFTPLEEQITRAKSTFGKFPEYATDFLCKPVSADEAIINVNDVIYKLAALSIFDVIGFTEKELGHSIFERANNIYRIRKALTDAGLEIPIHIFGCLDPLSVILYYLCGADIFDGLSWLRFSIKNGTPTYMNHHAISNGIWNKYDSEVKVISYAENLVELSQLKERLVKFTESSEWSCLGINEEELEQFNRIFEMIEGISDNE
ncbi:hypothetical protein BSK59_28820 [Paenibacillus odorifer]|uniref:hypothetical protein n=1 Tax=Paenibacillus odorifer TaxID=189426 RepID=UPI00096FC6A4|nr:hypothetical protein [Paenibacillus odorifer]OME46850.1 hypothetical protein BSK59_28820 [Paenibacillus odorifer]